MSNPSGGPDRQTGAFDLEAAVNDAAKVIKDPIRFYREMPTSGGFLKPLVFIVFMAAITGLIMMVVGLFEFGGQALVLGIGAMVYIPIFIGIFSFVGAAVMFVIWKLMGSEQNYQAAYRCVAYSGAVLPIVGIANLVPYLGSIVGIGWGMYLMAIASMEIHRLKREMAYSVCAALGLVLIVMNIANERESRRIGAQLEEFNQSLEDMTPEEAARAFEEIRRQIEGSNNEGED